jgi:hypothetical protein
MAHHAGHLPAPCRAVFIGLPAGRQPLSPLQLFERSMNTEAVPAG